MIHEGPLSFWDWLMLNCPAHRRVDLTPEGRRMLARMEAEWEPDPYADFDRSIFADIADGPPAPTAADSAESAAQTVKDNGFGIRSS